MNFDLLTQTITKSRHVHMLVKYLHSPNATHLSNISMVKRTANTKLTIFRMKMSSSLSWRLMSSKQRDKLKHINHEQLGTWKTKQLNFRTFLKVSYANNLLYLEKDWNCTFSFTLLSLSWQEYFKKFQLWNKSEIRRGSVLDEKSAICENKTVSLLLFEIALSLPSGRNRPCLLSKIYEPKSFRSHSCSISGTHKNPRYSNIFHDIPTSLCLGISLSFESVGQPDFFARIYLLPPGHF